jgi:hypothetical protein
MKPTLDQVSKVPMAPIIPTVGREYNGNIIIVCWTDGSVSEYEFDRGPSDEIHHNSMKDFQKYRGTSISEYNYDSYLTTLFKRHFILVDKVYLGEL